MLLTSPFLRTILLLWKIIRLSKMSYVPSVSNAKIHEPTHLAKMHNVCYIFVYSLHNIQGAWKMSALATLEPMSIILDEINNTVENDIVEQQEEKEEAFKTPEQSAQQMLVERVLQGDKEAFGEIIKQYNALMMRTAYTIIGDRDVAEDAVQEALIQAWQHLSGL